jgi:hypothetical protein
MPTRPFEPCIPTPGTKVPVYPDWIHEIKHDGYRLIVQKDHKRVRLFTRNGHDWTENRSSSFVIDGEAVLLGVDGDFDGLHSGKHDSSPLHLRLPRARRRRPAQAAIEPAQNQSRPVAGTTPRWDLPRTLRAGRNRTGSVPQGL